MKKQAHKYLENIIHSLEDYYKIVCKQKYLLDLSEEYDIVTVLSSAHSAMQTTLQKIKTTTDALHFLPYMKEDSSEPIRAYYRTIYQLQEKIIYETKTTVHIMKERHNNILKQLNALSPATHTHQFSSHHLAYTCNLSI